MQREGKVEEEDWSVEGGERNCSFARETIAHCAWTVEAGKG